MSNVQPILVTSQFKTGKMNKRPGRKVRNIRELALRFGVKSPWLYRVLVKDLKPVSSTFTQKGGYRTEVFYFDTLKADIWWAKNKVALLTRRKNIIEGMNKCTLESK